ncbi:MAG: cobalamin-dependent protein [Syntrophaceae bacterium]
MEEHDGLSELGRALADLDEGGVEHLVRQHLDHGMSPEAIINELSAGMAEVGELFRQEEYFLTELIYSGDIFKNAMAVLQPLCKTAADGKAGGVVVLGTVQGDIHDLGKNIVVTLLECAGFTVVDIGVDVPAQRFVEAAVESQAVLVGMSMLLTTAFDAARETITAFTQANLRDKVKIMIGGSVTNENVKQDMGADFWGKDATAAVDIARAVCQ